MVNVKYTSKLRLDLGREKERVQAKSMAELMAILEVRHGEPFLSLLPYCRIFINGTSLITLDSPGAALSDGDEVLFLLPVAGG